VVQLFGAGSLLRDAITLYPFMAYRRAAQGQHRVLFLTWTKNRASGFWDPLDEDFAE
jgi:hypothetical protein